jgi:hypothetical protein
MSYYNDRRTPPQQLVDTQTGQSQPRIGPEPTVEQSWGRKGVGPEPTVEQAWGINPAQRSSSQHLSTQMGARYRAPKTSSSEHRPATGGTKPTKAAPTLRTKPITKRVMPR